MSTRSLSPPAGSSPSSSRRSGAGDALLWAASGLNTHNKPPQRVAAHCSRRKAALDAWGNQASTAPTSGHNNACSQAQRRCTGVVAATDNSASGGTPLACSAGAQGVCGAPTNTSPEARPPATPPSATPEAQRRTKAGSTSDHSPCPGWACNTSTKAPQGQPPPGKQASRHAWPLAHTGRSGVGNWAAHHRPDKASSSGGKRQEGVDMGKSRKKEGLKARQLAASPSNCIFIQYSQACQTRGSITGGGL